MVTLFSGIRRLVTVVASGDSEDQKKTAVILGKKEWLAL
jgi:hypothetical protein